MFSEISFFFDFIYFLILSDTDINEILTLSDSDIN